MSSTTNLTSMTNRCDILLKSYHEDILRLQNRYSDLVFDVCEQYYDGISQGEIDEVIKEYVLKIKE